MKQVTQIKMGAYIYNGAPLDMTSFRAFQTYPNSYKVWNVKYEYSPDFLGGAVQNTLSGYQRGNPLGHRLKCDISLNNALRTDTLAIRELLNLTASRYDRGFWTLGSTTTVADGDDNKLIYDEAPVLPVNYFKGLTVEDGSERQRLILSSTATSDGEIIITTVTVLGDWNNASNTVWVKPSHPTIIGVSFDDDVVNMQYFNIQSDSFGINRELTVGNQIIQMSLTGVFAEGTMNSNIVI